MGHRVTGGVGVDSPLWPSSANCRAEGRLSGSRLSALFLCLRDCSNLPHWCKVPHWCMPVEGSHSKAPPCNDTSLLSDCTLLPLTLWRCIRVTFIGGGYATFTSLRPLVSCPLQGECPAGNPLPQNCNFVVPDLDKVAVMDWRMLPTVSWNKKSQHSGQMHSLNVPWHFSQEWVVSCNRVKFSVCLYILPPYRFNHV